MAINSREKGRRGEIELAHKLEEFGYNARRGQQFSGANGDPDVIGLPGVHIECKRVEKLNIDKAMQQAQNDSRPSEMPCVFHRRNNRPWLVTMPLECFISLYKRAGVEDDPNDN